MKSDPEYMNQMINNNTMLSSKVNADPQLRAKLTDPQQLQSMMIPEYINAQM